MFAFMRIFWLCLISIGCLVYGCMQSNVGDSIGHTNDCPTAQMGDFNGNFVITQAGQQLINQPLEQGKVIKFANGTDVVCGLVTLPNGSKASLVQQAKIPGSTTDTVTMNEVINGETCQVTSNAVFVANPTDGINLSVDVTGVCPTLGQLPPATNQIIGNYPTFMTVCESIAKCPEGDSSI